MGPGIWRWDCGLTLDAVLGLDNGPGDLQGGEEEPRRGPGARGAQPCGRMSGRPPGSARMPSCRRGPEPRLAADTAASEAPPRGHAGHTALCPAVPLPCSTLTMPTSPRPWHHLPFLAGEERNGPCQPSRLPPGKCPGRRCGGPATEGGWSSLESQGQLGGTQLQGEHTGSGSGSFCQDRPAMVCRPWARESLRPGPERVPRWGLGWDCGGCRGVGTGPGSRGSRSCPCREEPAPCQPLGEPQRLGREMPAFNSTSVCRGS